MASRTIKVASRLPLTLRISEPHPNPDKPGESPDLRTVDIAGTNNGIVGAPFAVTEVDADLFRKWKEANPYHPAVVGGHVFEAKEDAPEMQFGFEPGLDALVNDGDNSGKASDGSLLKDAKPPVRATDMAATSDAPNDDSPRSQTGPNAAPMALPAPAQAPKK